MSLIETILSASLTVIITTLAICVLSLPSIKSAKQIELREDLYAIEKISALLETVIEDFDRHSIKIIPKITTNKISSIAISPIKTFRLSEPVTVYKDSNSAFTVKGCPLFDGRSFISQGFLGVSPDGVIALKEIAKSSAGRCKTFTLAATTSQVIPKPDFPELTITRLIPIEREYSLEIEKGELRYQGYRGGQMIENQPILRGVEQISYNLQHNSSGAFELAAKILLASNHSYQKIFPKHLANQPIFNLFYENFR